jgi:membrane fusion protein (multidrug efflux system)
MKRRAKFGVWVIVIAALIVLFVVTGARRMQKEEVKSIESVQKAEGIPVDVVTAQAVPLENWRKFVGVAEGYEQVNLVAPFRTRVSRVHVTVGQEVGPGKVLISLDSYDPAWAGMNLQTARAGYETARQDSIRVEELFKTGAVSQQDLDHTRAATDGARAHYTTARRAVELDTPISGMVTALNVNAGDYAASEQTLATVASYGRIRVPLEVSETDRALVQVGQPVRLAYGDMVLEGSVVKVALSADPSSRLFAIEVVIENGDRLLKPGMLVTPEILVARADARPVVSTDAIVKSDGEEHVFVVDRSGSTPVARLRQVVRGIESGTMAAIDQGITPGDVVVVWGQNNLEDGARVKIHEDLTASMYKATR